MSGVSSLFLTACGVQDGVADDQDEESDRETSFLQIELEIMKALEQIQMLQQVSNCSLHHQGTLACCSTD